MGDGGVAPKYSPESRNEQQFQSRLESTGVDTNTDARDSVESSSDTTSGGSNTRSASSGGVDGSIGGESAEQWQASEKTPARFFAVNDTGYSDELASHFKSMSNDELRDKIDEIYEDHGFDTADSRFVAGVLASRSDANFSISDMYRVNVSATAADDVDSVANERELVNEFSDQFDEVFEDMDEYVAGQVASNIEEINIQSTISRQVPGRGIQQKEVLGSFNSGELYYHPKTAAGVDGGSEPVSTVAHELGHVVMDSYGLAASGEASSVAEQSYRPEYTGDVTERAAAFRDSLAAASCDIRDSVVRGQTPSSDSSMAGGSQAPLRTYQLQDSDEMLAVGHSVYQSDIVTASTLQPEMVDHIDEFVTGHGWQETSVDDVTTRGVGIDHHSKDPSHLPDQRAGEGDLYDGGVGEVVRVELDASDGVGSPTSSTLQVGSGDSLQDTELNRVAGYAVGVSADSITVVQNGQEVEIPRDRISSVHERQWSGEE